MTLHLVRMSFVVALAALAAAGQAAEPTPEQLHIGVQQICPVSGLPLGDHGPPVKVLVGEQEEEIFLCCKACATRQIDAAHWKTIHTNIAAAQRVCPVMKKDLPAKPAWEIIGGRVVFVCCPPCLKKIAAEPESHLQQIDQLYAESLQTERGVREER
jgi:hypothetical protein